MSESGVQSDGPPHETLTARRTDLGTLGGRESSAVAVDGQIVVGEAELPHRSAHAFVFDLRAPSRGLRDLGTLKGDTGSYATAVSGDLVVGASTAPGSSERWSKSHAFVYDLGAVTPRMRDLGTLGGTHSIAWSVSGDVVVGESATAAGIGHAFAYDLAAANPRMLDLGTLGGEHSYATKVDHNLVVGVSDVPSHATHAFAYDLRDLRPAMRDLGSLVGGGSSAVADLSGSIVVGAADSDSSGQVMHGFVYDLHEAHPQMKDLGDLSGGEGSSEAAAVDGTTVVGDANVGDCQHPTAYAVGPHLGLQDLGTIGGCVGSASDASAGIVVGVAERSGDGQWRLVASDLGAAAPRLTDLGALSPVVPPVISGNIVAGTMTAGNVAHAAVWTLSRTRQPVVRFKLFNLSAPENAGSVRVTVTRTGDPASAVTVPYITKGLTARNGRDFTATSGTLSFAAGQSTASLTVPVRDDSVTERSETLMVLLGRPTPGTIRGTPNVVGVTIRASDQQPDALISLRATRGYVGSHIYNSTGARQTRLLRAHRGHTRRFYIEVYNTGNGTNIITLHGSHPRTSSVIHYYRGSTDITAAVSSTRGLSLRIGRHSDRRITMSIMATTTATIGQSLPASVAATWTGDGTRTDLVKGIVRVVR